MSDTSAQTFLFDANYPGLPGYYGGVFDSAFLEALSAADPQGCTSSRVLEGDALIAEMCTKTTAVSRSRDARGRNVSSSTISHDMDLVCRQNLLDKLAKGLRENLAHRG